MKSLLNSLCFALLSVFALATAPAAQAQVTINIGPPSWGPAVPAGAQYYYIPETNGFYDVPARQYVVSRNGRWVRTATLSGYNPATFRPVVIDYVGAQPWIRYNEYKVKYPKKGHPHGLPPGQAKKLYKNGYRDGRHDDDDRDDDHGHKHKNKGKDKD
ncbi:hypothetical protein [Hymenobacter sp.]|uniref:hypothetical protein n=1 Tax=Hymenobacter sp. TaxID=1898978 RepID=UPI00286A2EC4|nr:hypothetical protein [Hymenobacter sp.]